MLNILQKLFFAFFLSCLAHPAFAVVNTQNRTFETITLVADEWCPYNCQPEAALPGYMIELAQKAFLRQGIKLQYLTMPWPQAIELTRAGKYTAIVGASKKDAADFIFPTSPQGRMVNKFFVRKGSPWRFSGIPSLQGKVLAIMPDYSYDGGVLDIYIAQNRKNPSAILLPPANGGLPDNLKALLSGKVDTVVEDARVMGYYAMVNKLVSQLDEAGNVPESPSNALFLAFSPANPKSKTYAELLTREIARMRVTGELKQILDKYGVADWQ